MAADQGRRPAFTVGQLTALVRSTLDGEPALEDVLVQGEVSNLRLPGSGHIYFTLKDRAAALRCVCFRKSALEIPFHPTNGMTVVAHGRVDVYAIDGTYQLYVDRLEPAGIGALALAIEQLKRRLAAEGLFEEGRKRTPPLLPRRVAVVTSPTGAALRDVLTVLRRRAPTVEVVLVPTPVQGEGAIAGVVAALGRAQALARVDVVLLVRGGGAFEDLHVFQDEDVVRAVRASRVPVITGIGHETDTTVADLAADRRAATPSAAAELAVPDVRRLAADLQLRRSRLDQAVQACTTRARTRFDSAQARLDGQSPRRRLPQLRQQLDALVGSLGHALLREVAAKRRALQGAETGLTRASPRQRVFVERQRLGAREVGLARAAHAGLTAQRSRLALAGARLEALSPLRVLDRGYSVTLDEATGRTVPSVDAARVGMRLRTLVRGGALLSGVDGVDPTGGGSPERGKHLYDDPAMKQDKP